MKKERYYVKRYDSTTFWIKDRRFGTIEKEAKTAKVAKEIADKLNKEEKELYS